MSQSKSDNGGSSRIAQHSFKLGNSGRYRLLSLLVGLLVSMPLTANAQGTTVQLPTISNFSYSGSVLVPDSGGAYLGGSSRTSNYFRSYGFGAPNTHSNSLRSASDAQARVFIIDHQAWDRSVLGGTPEEFLRRHRTQQKFRSSAATTENSWLPGQKAASSTDVNARGKQLVRKGRAAAEQGDQRLTKYYYQLAKLYLDDNLARLAEAEYQ